MKQRNLKKNSFEAVRSKYPAVKIWGITGGIASGKSTFATILRRQGYIVVDADQISRSLFRTPRIRRILKRTFGFDRRSQIRRMAFESPTVRRKLEKILHPEIRKKSIEAFVSKISKKSRIPEFVFYEAALIIEKKIDRDLDGLIVVTTSLSNQFKRLKKRNPNLGPSLMKQIVSSQTTPKERQRRADLLVVNNDTVSSLTRKSRQILNKIEN